MQILCSSFFQNYLCKGNQATEECVECYKNSPFFNAIGGHVRPVWIFPRVHFKIDILSGDAAFSIGAANPTIWSNYMFDVDYLKYFMACELSGNEDPVCLILDKNYSQLSIATISVAKNDIYLLTLPSHTTHKLRPLNCTICGPFGTYGNIRLNDWILSNLSKLQHSTVFQLLFENFFGKSFIKLKTGIFCST